MSAHVCTVYSVIGFSEVHVGSQHGEKPKRSVYDDWLRAWTRRELPSALGTVPPR